MVSLEALLEKLTARKNAFYSDGQVCAQIHSDGYLRMRFAGDDYSKGMWRHEFELADPASLDAILNLLKTKEG